MGLLVTLSGLVIALYAAFSALGLWLARRIERARDGGEDVAELVEGMPAHHVELLSTYAVGARGRLWMVSVAAAAGSVLSLAAGSTLAVYLFGIALGLDSWLFSTWRERAAFLAKATPAERLADIAQCLALLAAFCVLAWRQMFAA